MNMFKKLNSMFSSEEDEIFEEENQREQTEQQRHVKETKTVKNNNVKKQTTMLNVEKKEKVILTEPIVFADSKDIIDNLKANKVVIINLSKLDLQTSDRLLDFISGGIYAIDAKLKSIGEEVYLCVPKDVDVTGEFSEGEH